MESHLYLQTVYFYTESSDMHGSYSKPPGHKKTNDMRIFMENFARNRNLNPLQPSTWYHAYESVIRSKVHRQKRVISGDEMLMSYIHSLSTYSHLITEGKENLTEVQRWIYPSSQALVPRVDIRPERLRPTYALLSSPNFQSPFLPLPSCPSSSRTSSIL